jgi:hypothetical protein
VEKMESAKNNLQLVESSTEIIDQRKAQFTKEADTKARVSDHEQVKISEISSEIRGNRKKQIGETVTKSFLINKLNYINFQDGTVFINFKHHKYDKTLTLLAKPQPCIGGSLDCLWADADDFRQITQSYEFRNLMLADGNRLLLVEPQLISLSKKGISIALPQKGYEVSARSKSRHLCQGITVQFIQNSSQFKGALIDFNASSFKVELKAIPPQTFEWINPETTSNLILSEGQETLYAGECRIIRHMPVKNKRCYVLEPLKHQIQRFKQKAHRSERQELNPSPDIVFRHPFTKKMISRKVIDLSGAGFAVEEDKRNSVLLAGMIIPELELNFANSFKLKCSAQVVYQKDFNHAKENNTLKCGLAILDMDIQQHAWLIALLDQAKNGNAYVCNPVDLDDLWDFFFETGFIYPEKYALIQKNKQQIKETYEKLYNRNPHIARHLIYQENGRIMGHMAMIRFYKNTWLIQHHTARKSALNKAGLVVLSRIGRLSNDSHRLYSLHMDHCICYFRHNNKFPSCVFGGAAKAINNSKKCSVDSFAYLYFKRGPNNCFDMDKTWCLTKTQMEDLFDLDSLYNYVSGGLMLSALDLKPNKLDLNELSTEYHNVGLRRERYLFSLKKDSVLKAIVMVNKTNLGLNLSELTNSIKIFVLDSEGLSKEILDRMLLSIAERIEINETPVLLFPLDYVKDQSIQFDKVYNLWILDLRYIDEYFNYVNRLLRFI